MPYIPRLHHITGWIAQLNGSELAHFYGQASESIPHDWGTIRPLFWLTSLLCALIAGALPPGSLRQCGSIVIRLPVSTSHRRIELSLLPEKAVVSSGDSTTHVGVNLCPRICRTADAAISCPCKPFATYEEGGWSSADRQAIIHTHLVGVTSRVQQRERGSVGQVRLSASLNCCRLS